MRTLIIAPLLALSATAAIAQPQPTLPPTPAPAAAAAFEQREDWCQNYASWLITNTPAQATPSDVRPTQRFETEFNSCKLDPQQYEQETRADAQQIIASEHG